MDGGTEQNPAYGTALTFIYSDFVDRNGVLTLTHTLTDLEFRISERQWIFGDPNEDLLKARHEEAPYSVEVSALGVARFLAEKTEHVRLIVCFLVECLLPIFGPEEAGQTVGLRASRDIVLREE